MTDVYLEKRKYEWVKSKNRTRIKFDAYKTLSDLLPADWYKKNTLVYILDEQQVYRAKHTKHLQYIGKKEA